MDDLVVDPQGACLNFSIRIPKTATIGLASISVFVSRPNEYTYGPGVSANFTISLFGDLNLDNRIDIIDIAIANAAFGSYSGHPRWNPMADINKDDKIDISDLATVSSNFGRHYP